MNFNDDKEDFFDREVEPVEKPVHPLPPPGQGGEYALVVAVQELSQVGQPPVTVHAGQQLEGGDVQLGRLLQRRVPVPPLGQQGILPATVFSRLPTQSV